MFSTYKPEDVTILLKDITGMVTPLGTKEREQLIQRGVHYSEMLPIEYVPSKAYLDMFFKAMKLYSERQRRLPARHKRSGLISGMRLFSFPWPGQALLWGSCLSATWSKPIV